MQKKYSSKEITTTFFLLTATSHFILVLFELISGAPIIVAGPYLKSIAGLIASVTLGTALFYITHQNLIKKAGPLYSSFYLYLNPVASTLLAILLLGEKLTPSVVLGGGLTFLGVWIYGRK